MEKMKKALLCLLLMFLLSTAALAADSEASGTVHAAFDGKYLLSSQSAELTADGGTDADVLENAVLSAVKSHAATTVWFTSPYSMEIANWQNQVFDLYWRTIFDHAEECFNVSTEVTLSYNNTDQIRLSISYLENQGKAVYEAAVEKACAACFCDGMTDLEKIISCYSWVAANCQYDPYTANGRTADVTVGSVVYGDDPSVFTSYGVFVNRSAVCQGYALAMGVLLDRVGIENVLTTGTANGGDHAWNRVKLNGVWYHVDATWADPVYNTYKDIPGRVFYKYLLLGDSTISDSDYKHTSWQDANTYPCPSDYPSGENSFWQNSTQPIQVKDNTIYYIMGGTLYSAAAGTNFAGAAIQRLGTDVTASLVCGDRLYYTPDGETVFSCPLVGGTAERVVFPQAVTTMCGLRMNSDGQTLELVSGWAVKSALFLLKNTDKSQPVYFTWGQTLNAGNCAGASITLNANGQEIKSVRIIAVYSSKDGKVLKIALLSGSALPAYGTYVCVLPQDIPSACAKVSLFALDGDGWQPVSACAALNAA